MRKLVHAIHQELQLGKRVEKYPRKDSENKNRDVIPDGLGVLELGSEEAVEVVLDDEDPEEVWVAEGAEDVPRESGEAEAGDGDRVEATQGVGPAFGESGPDKNRAAGENEGGRTFGESGEAEKEAEEE